jgi:cell wall-associated NlpC family hydrolase
MKRLLLAAAMAASGAAGADSFWEGMKAAIERHLGRPYVWGATGLKSFDCSGFVWRVLFENGILIKRTTARKLYLGLPAARSESQWQPGNIVFFDGLRHCGIVGSRSYFYHAETSVGTNQSRFEPYWRKKVCGIRAAPRASR